MRPPGQHGIDVEALERAADEVQSLVRTEELRQLAAATRDAALARERARLDALWTWWGSRACPPHRARAREHLLNAEAWLLDELRSLLFARAELLRVKGHERSCDYGQLARDEIHESVAALSAIRVALGR